MRKTAERFHAKKLSNQLSISGRNSVPPFRVFGSLAGWTSRVSFGFNKTVSCNRDLSSELSPKKLLHFHVEPDRDTNDWLRSDLLHKRLAIKNYCKQMVTPNAKRESGSYS